MFNEEELSLEELDSLIAAKIDEIAQYALEEYERDTTITAQQACNRAFFKLKIRRNKELKGKYSPQILERLHSLIENQKCQEKFT